MGTYKRLFILHLTTNLGKFCQFRWGGRQSSDLPTPVLHCFEYLAVDLPVSSIPEHLYPRSLGTHALPNPSLASPLARCSPKPRQASPGLAKASPGLPSLARVALEGLARDSR